MVLYWLHRWETLALRLIRQQDAHVGGWFSDHEGAMLHMLATLLLPGDTAVEIGSFMGKSTRWFFIGTEVAGAHLVCIDPFESSGEGEPEQIKDYYHQIAPQGSLSVWVGNMVPVCGSRMPQDMIEIMRSRSRDAAKVWDCEAWDTGTKKPLPRHDKITLLFIDGQHEECLQDLQAWEPHLEPHAMVVLHDVSGTGAYGENGPDNTLFYMQQGGWELYARTDLVAGLTRDPGWWETRREARAAEYGAVGAYDSDHSPARWVTADGRRGTAPSGPDPLPADGPPGSDNAGRGRGGDGSPAPDVPAGGHDPAGAGAGQAGGQGH